jgi:hypothetical protein
VRPDPVKDELDKTGLKLTKGERDQSTAYRPAILDWNPTAKRHPWWYAHACARIGRILEGAKPSFGSFSRDAALESAIKNAAHPKCAKRYMETWSYFMTRFRPSPVIGTDHNPFRGLSDSAAYAKWYVLIESICEASTGKLGPWRAGISASGAARNK